jgi:hexokinase
MPLVKEHIQATLRELLGAAGDNIDTLLENGGSGLGAAIAAAMAEK